jgi:hypothetical protein
MLCSPRSLSAHRGHRYTRGVALLACALAFAIAPSGAAAQEAIEDAKLLATDGAGGDQFGSSVAFSASGDTALVGADLADTTAGADAGAAYVFTRDGAGTWTQQAKIVANDAAANDYFGESVALSSSGDTALVGAPNDETGAGNAAGSAYVFDLPDTDGDGTLDLADNCPSTANADQLDTDGDLLGNVCDPDMDGDGVSNTDEAGAGTDPLNPDTDGDGFTDAAALAAGSNPLDSSSTPAAAVPSGSVESRLLLLALLLGLTQLRRGLRADRKNKRGFGVIAE